jgi:hypothetical protein
MIQKDYLERAIESFAQIVAFIIGRTKAGEHEDAQVGLQEAAERYIGFSLGTLDSFSFEGLRSLLRVGGSLDVQRCLMLADLRVLEARLREAEGFGELALRSYSVALRLYMEAAEDRGFAVLEGHGELAEIAASHLRSHELGPEVQFALSHYLASTQGNATSD